MKAPQFKLALVTGATSGIGEATARLLASKGIPLILTGRNETKLQALSKELKADYLVADLSDKQGKGVIIRKIQERNPDLLINNAGLGYYGEAHASSVAEQMEILNVNGAAVLELTLTATKTLIDKKIKGTILNVSSSAAWVPFPLFAVYSASKAFVNELSLSLDYECRPYGVRVLASCPGRVATEFSRRAAHTPNASTKKSTKSMTSEYAAEQIWIQIEKGQTIRIFNGWYRLAIWFVKYILPTDFVAKTVRDEIAHLLNKYDKKDKQD